MERITIMLGSRVGKKRRYDLMYRLSNQRLRTTHPWLSRLLKIKQYEVMCNKIYPDRVIEVD